MQAGCSEEGCGEENHLSTRLADDDCTPPPPDSPSLDKRRGLPMPPMRRVFPMPLCAGDKSWAGEGRSPDLREER